MAPQKMTYEVKGEPTAYFLAECFQTMIQGLVSSVNQREEHQQREFLAMMSSTDGTIENWPWSLWEYSTAFKAGYKSDPDSPNFMEEMNGEHSKEYWEEAMGIWTVSVAMGSHMGCCANKPSTQDHQYSTANMGIQA